MAIQWDPKRGVYLKDGKIVNKGFVKVALYDSVAASSDILAAIAAALAAGDITESAARTLFQQELKQGSIRSYLLARGGRDSMTKSDWGIIGNNLRDQYKYARDFLKGAAQGDYTPAQLANYSNMYANGETELYSRARGKIIDELGFDLVRWQYGETENHCATCITRHDLGEVPVGPKGGFMQNGNEYFPGDGSTECLTNDRCDLEYLKGDTDEMYNYL